MCCNLYELVHNFFFVRETSVDITQIQDVVDRDTLIKECLIPQGTSSSDFFDYSMYLYNCPPERGGDRLCFQIYLPCKELENKDITVSDISSSCPGKSFNLFPPIKMSFRYTPVKTATLVNMHHFSLFFRDENGHEYDRNRAKSSEKNFARHFVAKYLASFVILDNLNCREWNREDDAKLLAFSALKISSDITEFGSVNQTVSSSVVCRE